MTYLLHIDTATEVCSIAVSRDDELIALNETDEGYTHAENLTRMIGEAVSEAKIELVDLNAIAVNVGPGSYTGLRIGAATVKGMAYALNIPVISVTSVSALVHHPGLKGEKGMRIPMIDARRMEVYTAVYDEQLREIEKVHARILTPDDFEKYEAKCLILGNGAAKCEDLFAGRGNISVRADLKSTARGMILPAHEKFKRRDFEDTAYFEPFYLKDFTAGKPKKYIV